MPIPDFTAYPNSLTAPTTFATDMDTMISEFPAFIAAANALSLADKGVTAGTVIQVDQAVTAWTRAATTTLGTSLNGTLSDTSTTITAFAGVVGVTYHCRCLGAGAITHHGTNLIITQTGASIAATAAGDTFDVEMLTASTCRIKNYLKADGTALVAPTNISGNSSTATSLWQQTTGTFTATPASTSTITMTTDLTASILVGMTLKYVIGGVTYYGRVAAIAANLLTVNGAPLGGDVTALYYGGGSRSMPSYDATVNVDGTANTTVLLTGTVFTHTWRGPKSYIVHYEAIQTIHDSGTHGKFTIKAGGTDINTSAGGLVIAANATKYQTVVDINAAAYDINDGEDITAVVTQGSTVDGAGLRFNMVILTP